MRVSYHTSKKDERRWLELHVSMNAPRKELKCVIACIGNSNTFPVMRECIMILCYITLRYALLQRRGKEVWMGHNHGVWGTGVPQWGAGDSRVYHKVVTSKFYAFLVVCHTPSCMYVFSVLAGIIPLSLRNGGGIWYRLPPLSASGGGQLPPPDSAAYALLYYNHEALWTHSVTLLKRCLHPRRWSIRVDDLLSFLLL